METPVRGVKRFRDVDESSPIIKKAKTIDIDECSTQPPPLFFTQTPLLSARNLQILANKFSNSQRYEMDESLDALRDCYKNPDMEFKCAEQQELMETVLHRKKDVIAVLPTGGGKSAAFEVPAAVEEGLQTVVVIPFVALLKDIFQRAHKLKIKVCQWHSKKEWPRVTEASLVLVIYESALGAGFKQ